MNHKIFFVTNHGGGKIKEVSETYLHVHFCIHFGPSSLKVDSVPLNVDVDLKKGLPVEWMGALEEGSSETCLESLPGGRKKCRLQGIGFQENVCLYEVSQ